MSTNETSPAAAQDPWDNLRKAQVGVIIAASRNVNEAMQHCARAHGEVWRLERELKKARDIYDAALQERDDRTAKVTEFVREYAVIGEKSLRLQRQALLALIDSPDFRIAGGLIKVSSLRALLGEGA